MTSTGQLNNLVAKIGSIPRTILVSGLMLIFVAGAASAGAAANITIHTFENTGDGEFPQAGLSFDGATGTLVGTTFGSVGSGAPGKNCGKSCGNQYEINNQGKLTTNYFFMGGTDGAFPTGELAVQSDGSIYGTTELGGANACGGLGCGTAFLILSGTNSPKIFKFCPNPDFPQCTNGAFPRAGPILGSDGNLYGTTMLGGAGAGYECDNDFGGCGTVYRLTPDLNQQTAETVLYNFCSQAQCTDGAVPLGKLWQDTSGDLYGTTQFGGLYGGGTIFELQPNGHYQVLYSFCPDGATNCNSPQGSIPEAGLIPDGAGYLYGTASAGGGGDCTGSSHGCGVVFKIALDGSNQYTMLYAFKGHKDGALPQAPLVYDPTTGNLYGTTEKGGHGSHCVIPPIGCGTVFALANGKETKLHTFGRLSSRKDGAQPQGALLLQNGTLYGATLAEGDRTGCNCGTLFAINIGSKNQRDSSQPRDGLRARR